MLPSTIPLLPPRAVDCPRLLQDPKWGEAGHGLLELELIFHWWVFPGYGKYGLFFSFYPFKKKKNTFAGDLISAVSLGQLFAMGFFIWSLKICPSVLGHLLGLLQSFSSVLCCPHKPALLSTMEVEARLAHSLSFWPLRFHGLCKIM